MNFVKISGGSKPYRQALVDDIIKSTTNSYIKFDNPTLAQVQHAVNYYSGKATVIFVDPELGVEDWLIGSNVSASVVLVKQ